MNLRIRVSPFCCLRTSIYVSYLLVTFYLISRLDLVVEQSDEAKVQRSKDCSPETTRDVTSGSRESTSFTLEDGVSSGDVTSLRIKSASLRRGISVSASGASRDAVANRFKSKSSVFG